MFHDNLQEEALWSIIAERIVESKVPDKHDNDVKVIGAGYALIVLVCKVQIELLLIKYSWE